MIPCIVTLLGGIVSCSVGIWHEWKWRIRFKRGQCVRGKVVGMMETGEDSHPEIEYLHEGMVHRFVSAYSGFGGTGWGEEVSVLYDSETGDAEVLSFSRRWLFTIVPLLLGLVCLYVFSGIIQTRLAEQDGEADTPPLMEFVVDFLEWGRQALELEIIQPHGGARLSLNVIPRNSRS